MDANSCGLYLKCGKLILEIAANYFYKNILLQKVSVTFSQNNFERIDTQRLFNEIISY